MGGGGQEKTTQVQTNDPWSGQQPYLTQAMSEAQKVYGQTKDAPGYTGDFYAAPRPEQLDTFSNALNFANGAGKGVVDGMSSAGGQQLGAGLTGSQGALSGIMRAGSTDNTQANIASAQAYANNPAVDGMITAAMRDANRNASENDIPNLYRGAAATGNLNSDRTALAQGVVERGLAEKTADTSSQIRGAMFDKGLDMAQADSAQRLQALQAAGALGTGMVDQGGNLMSGSVDTQGKMLDFAGTASDRLYAADQTELDNTLAKQQYAESRPWDALQNYYGIIGDKSWGGTTTSVGTTKSQPSALSTIGSVAGILGSLFKCDERVKNKIAVIGTFMEGIPLWVFSYKDDPDTLHLGPMAQDVEKHFPDAIVEIDGVKHINIRKLI